MMMIAKFTVLPSLAVVVMLAVPALAQAPEPGQGAPALHEDLPPPGEHDGRRELEEDDDQFERWQREDDADRRDEANELRQQQRHDKELDKKFDEHLDKKADEPLDRPEPESE
jgi:hypothetical protein